MCHGVLPSPQNLGQFESFRKYIESILGYKLDIFSGGATTRPLVTLGTGFYPPRINNIRVGEAFLLYTGRSLDVPEIPWLRQDTMTLEAELLEVRRKTPMPTGEVGTGAFNRKSVFMDKGERMRGILSMGKQDIDITGIVPLESGVRIITASSGHLIVDIEDCPVHPKLVDILHLRPDYAAMLAAFT